MKQYRKKPVCVYAEQWLGHNLEEVMEFCQGRCDVTYVTTGDGSIRTDVFIDTLEGRMHASVGDYIIQGVNGEYYPCKPNIFWKTYEEVTE